MRRFLIFMVAYTFGITAMWAQRSDVNGDGIINSADVVCVYNDIINGDGDDDGGEFKPSDLLGGYWIYGGKLDSGNRTEFFPDGTCSYVEYNDGEVTKREKGTYLVTGDKLLVYFESFYSTNIIKLLKRNSKMVLLQKTFYDDEYTAVTYISNYDSNDDRYNAADLVGGSWIDNFYGYKYVYRADDTFTETDNRDNESQGYYGINGNKLRLFYKYGNSDTYRIISLQKNKELILLDEYGDTLVFGYNKQ